jgi:glycosyltransferase involved in cell wall biosynthesis
MILRTRRVLAGLRPDVVHTHQRATLLYGGAAARLLRVPLVVHTEHTREAYGTRLRTRMLGRLSGNFCDIFYCLTRNLAELVCDNGVVPARKVRVIRNGIDIASFTDSIDTAVDVRRVHGIPEGAPLIGVVARHSAVKALDVLLRAFAKVRLRLPDARLVLVGDGPTRPDLERLAAELGMSGFTHFVGFQPHSGPFLRAMDVFTLASREEGMPQSALEAAVVGVPIVATRVGGIPEFVEHDVTGLLVEAGDPDGHADALCKVLQDRRLRERLVDAARDRVVSGFSVARMAADYHRDFANMLGR